MFVFCMHESSQIENMFPVLHWTEIQIYELYILLSLDKLKKNADVLPIVLLIADRLLNNWNFSEIWNDISVYF